MVGNETNILTMTEAIEKQNTDRIAISKPNAGIRSGMLLSLLFVLDVRISIDDCDDANVDGIFILASAKPNRDSSGVDYNICIITSINQLIS